MSTNLHHDSHLLRASARRATMRRRMDLVDPSSPDTLRDNLPSLISLGILVVFIAYLFFR
jgi:hypothetical protein